MVGYNDTVTFNGISLYVTSVGASRRQKTIKQIMGKTVTQTEILGLSTQQWELEISGKILGATVTLVATNRAVLEALDNTTPYAYTDGIHDGTYIMVPGSLRFNDNGETGNTSFEYSFSLIEQ